MAQRRLNIQVVWNGPDPIIGDDSGGYDKRTTAVNLSKLIRGLNQGSQYRANGEAGQAPQLILQRGIAQAVGTVTFAAVATNDEVNVIDLDFVAKQLRASGTITPGTAGNAPQAGDTVSVAGVEFTAVNGAVVLGEATFDISGNAAAICASLTAQFNAYASPLLSGRVSAKDGTTLVTFYAQAIGTGGNSIALASSNNTRLAKSGTTLENGAARGAYQFDKTGTNAETAADFVTAAQLYADMNAYFDLSRASNVVTFTARVPGQAGNALAFDTSNHTRLAVDPTSGHLEDGNMGNPICFSF